MNLQHFLYKSIALLFFGGAVLLFSCSDVVVDTVVDPETVPTQISYNHKILSSKDGKRQYRFETPLLERYELAKEPFMEFREGIKIETFSDSVGGGVESELTANYAHFNEVSEIWEARGNVIAHNIKGEKWLYTEILFWDQKKKIIYTHERAKVIDGQSSHYGKGFEADESFDSWSFNNTQGQIEVQTEPVDSAAEGAGSVPDSNPDNAAATNSGSGPRVVRTVPGSMSSSVVSPDDPRSTAPYKQRPGYDYSKPRDKQRR